MTILSFESVVEQMLLFLNDYGFILIILFAIIHPIFEGPFALFTLSLGIALLGITTAYILVFTFNMIGCLLLIFLVKKVDKFSNYYLHRHKVSNDVLVWLKETKKWKHIFVLGVPVIPTYPVKIGYLLGEPSTKDSMMTLLGAYIFLYVGNTLIYFGFLNIVQTGIMRIISVLLLLLLVLFVYFGKSLFSKISITKKEA